MVKAKIVDKSSISTSVMSTSLICHFLIGLPGSGKSTFAAQLAGLGNYRIVSTDAIREELYGNQCIQGDWTKIEARVICDIIAATKNGYSVIYDATNTRRVWRLDFLEKISSHPSLSVWSSSIQWMGWYLKTPIEICKYRNQQRSRRVPDTVIDEMYRNLEKFPPVPAEGFITVKNIYDNLDKNKDVNFDAMGFNLAEIIGEINRVGRTLINRRNRNYHINLHSYSKLQDFERLMYLLSLIIDYPGIGNLQSTNPKFLNSIFGETPNFADSLAEIIAFMVKLHGSAYADRKAISADLLWLEKNSFIGVNTIARSGLLPIDMGEYLGDFPLDLPTHAYSDLPAFERLLYIIQFILHHPFSDGHINHNSSHNSNPHQSSLQSLISGMIGRKMITGNVFNSIRKDIEKVLKPYKILPNFPMRDGYFAGTAILSDLELIQVLQLLQSQAKSLNDPVTLEIYEKFSDRMQKAKLADSVYPIRGIANRSIIDPGYLPPESLSRNTAVLEQAIAEGKLLELNRFPGVGKFEGEETGFFLAFPLQIVFHNLAWYLGYELISGKEKGLLGFQRLDRLFIGQPKNEARSQNEQQAALNRLQMLCEFCGGIFLGHSYQDQKRLLDGNPKEKASVLMRIELWFNDKMFNFIAEGTRRFSPPRMKMSLPTVGRQLSLPKSIFCLKPTGDLNFPHRFRVTLPKWCEKDVELVRWILGFHGGVKVVKPQSLADQIKKIGGDILNIYS